MCKNCPRLPLVLIIWSICFPARGSEKMSPDISDIIERFEQACDWNQSVSMRISAETITTGNGVRKVNEGHCVQALTYRRDHDRIELIGKDCLLDKDADPDRAGFDPDKTDEFIRVITDTERVRAFKFAGGTSFSALVRQTNFKQEFPMYYHDPLSGNFLDGALPIAGGANHIVELLRQKPRLRSGTEEIDGVPCYVVESSTPQGVLTAWIAPQKGYNALKYVLRGGNNVASDSTSGGWAVVVDSIDVQKIGDRHVPVSGQRTHTIEFKDGQVTTYVTKVKRSDIELNPDFQRLDAFKINLPEGTRVRIEEFPGVHYIFQKGKIVPNVDNLFFEQIDTAIRRMNRSNLRAGGNDKKTANTESKYDRQQLPDRSEEKAIHSKRVSAHGEAGSSKVRFAGILFVAAVLCVAAIIVGRHLIRQVN
ncbi:MAG: hypothetical protein JSU94_21405 [Phycisphaerales bacterium]|nr:MAG: hypothetical protein JSU94_21405 [Phycisphaerales bacterium]